MYSLSIFVHYIKVTYEDDWEKLLIIIKYTQETRDENLTLKTNNMTMIDWYTDAAFAVHSDTKSHTGVVLTIVKGAIQFFRES